MRPEAADPFEAERPRLLRLAYRMLGSFAEAEDIVQTAWLRWRETDRASIRVPAAFLSRVVTRLCLDAMKSARVRRETYVGAWLPEPLVEGAEPEPDDGDLTLTLMMALERLSPLERAAFLLHDVFGVPLDEVATTLGREAPAVRQLASRARRHVRAERPRYPVPPEEGERIARAFFAASRSGDMTALGAMLAADVSFHSDGGGKRPAAIRPAIGLRQVMQVHKALAILFGKYGSTLLRTCIINGLPGFVTREADGEVQTTALDIEDGKVTAIYIMRNPDKLRHLH